MSRGCQGQNFASLITKSGHKTTQIRSVQSPLAYAPHVFVQATISCLDSSPLTKIPGSVSPLTNPAVYLLESMVDPFILLFKSLKLIPGIDGEKPQTLQLRKHGLAKLTPTNLSR